MPANVRIATSDVILIPQVSPVSQHDVRLAEGDAKFEEPKEVAIGFQKRPIHPAQVIVMTIGIVVTLLGTPYLITPRIMGTPFNH